MVQMITKKRIPAFPQRLYDMLECAEARGYDHVISWMPDGRSFKIHLDGARDDAFEKRFVRVLKMNAFNQSRFRSFLRQLQLYGFERTFKGPEKGVCRHALFVRGRRDVLENKSIDDFQAEQDNDLDEFSPGNTFRRILHNDNTSMFLKKDQSNYWMPSLANNMDSVVASQTNSTIVDEPLSAWDHVKTTVIPTTLRNLPCGSSDRMSFHKELDNFCGTSFSQAYPQNKLLQISREATEKTAIIGFDDDDTISTIEQGNGDQQITGFEWEMLIENILH